MSDWIGTISSVAALGAALAALVTIFEMRKQRMAMYRPDLVFARSDIYFYWYRDVGFGVPVACSSSEFDPERLDLTRAIPSVFLHAFNVGLGSAKRLTVDWKVDVNDCIAVLSTIDAEQKFKIWNDSAGCVTFEPAATRRSFVAFRHDVIRDVPFILPAGSDARPVRVDLPFAYVQFLAIYVYLWIEKARSGEEPKWPPLPSADLELKYRDIGDNEHTRVFRVTPSFFYLGIPDSTDTNLKVGQAEFKLQRR